MRRLIRRFPWAFGTSVIASLLGVGFAIGAGGEYQPDLAVLTATLIAVNWYTFFSYCSLFRAEESTLNYEIKRAPANRMISVAVRNPTRDRRIQFRWRLSGWRNGQPIEVSDSLQGVSSQYFVLRPGDEREETVVIQALRPVLGSDIGSAIQAGEPEQAVLRLDISWRDDVGDRGTIEPEYWAVDIRNCEVRRYQNPVVAERQWSILGGGNLKRLPM